MSREHASIFFDRRDYEILSIVDQALDQGGKRARTIFSASLHPHGIIELAASHAERMAMAVINLLNSIEAEQAEYRLMALRALLDEVLYSARTEFRYNTARVLIQMMKEIVRTKGSSRRRLMLAHDFRRAATGNPRVVRRFLRQYHLLEMPENFNQVAMDHHVHDSNTKGRKNPTHLLMDAWVKGLRYLTIIYYNYISPEAVRELFSAAKIMNIHVRVGLEYRVPFRRRYIGLVWEPSGLSDPDDALDFLRERNVALLMEEGRSISEWNTSHVLNMLKRWNSEILPSLNRELELELSPLEQEKFLEFVGSGQASTLHLAEMAHLAMLPALRRRFNALAREAGELSASPGEESRLACLRERMSSLNNMTPEVLLRTWLQDSKWSIPDPESSGVDAARLPVLAFSSPGELTERLLHLRGKSNIWLNLANLPPEDVLELLWDCRGRISHLESFNLKEWQEGQTPRLEEISALQLALNNKSPLPLKHIVSRLLRDAEAGGSPEDNRAKLREILRNLPALQKPYLRRPLRSRIGTDSTSNSSMRHGMGLLLPETLPAHARRGLRRCEYEGIMRLPIKMSITPRLAFFSPREAQDNPGCLARLLRRLLSWSRLDRIRKPDWIFPDIATFSKSGNVITIGGIGSPDNNLTDPGKHSAEARLSPAYLNAWILNSLKVCSGLLAAMLTFLYTQDWWFLAWFGAFIWFSITALRNIAQALLSGGALRRSLLRWNDYVNFSRLCDSLMYTGFSVPLLELGVRYLLMGKALGSALQPGPVLVFSVMAVANGLYIASHNIYRGFPRAAVIGNLFRSVLGIPCSVFYHHLLLLLLTQLGVSDAALHLQLGAAVISKAASDTVAGLIEGTADKRNNLRLRRLDYENKLSQVIENYTRLELAYPEKNILRLLSHPENLLELTKENSLPLLRVAAIANALDLMYFWDYQPQAQQALKRLVHAMAGEERVILARSQLVLSQVREVSQLFVDGLVGDHFSRALSFYLDRNAEYIRLTNALYLARVHARETEV